jgi:hypothetical protein
VDENVEEKRTFVSPSPSFEFFKFLRGINGTSREVSKYRLDTDRSISTERLTDRLSGVITLQTGHIAKLAEYSVWYVMSTLARNGGWPPFIFKHIKDIILDDICWMNYVPV